MKYRRLFIYLAIAFMLALIAGTILHELGHYTVAKYLGYEAKVHYSFTSYFPGWRSLLRNKSDFMWLALGGPLQTVVTGTIGFILIFINRRSYYSSQWLTLKQWVFIFLSFFWARQVINLVVWMATYFISDELPARGDEVKLALYFNLPYWTIISFTALLGMVILGIIIFKYIPIRQRTVFILSGLVGGTCGYILWFCWLGPRLMP